MHSNVTIKNVSWPHFSWPTLYLYVYWQPCSSEKLRIGNANRQGSLLSVFLFSLHVQVRPLGVLLPAVLDVINWSLLVVFFSLVRTMGPVVFLLSPSWRSTQELLKILELKCIVRNINETVCMMFNLSHKLRASSCFAVFH